MNEKILERYYQNIIELLVETNRKQFSEAQPGHCMKITGLGEEQLLPLWESLNSNFPKLDTFILNDEKDEEYTISATKLIELRNQQDNPLLILIPSGGRTAAEDSYGNATFKEISLENIDDKLKSKLIKELPDEIRAEVTDIIRYLRIERTTKVINYLLALEQFDFSRESVGENLYLLDLIPDSNLLEKPKIMRARLGLNAESIENLASFNKSIYNRVDDLKIQKNTLQKDFVQFFRKEPEIKSQSEIAAKIKENYPELWFEKWKKPNLDFDSIKLEVLQIKAVDLKPDEEGRMVYTSDGKTEPNLNLRFTTVPELKNLGHLKYFRVLLMAVDGEKGEEIVQLRKIKQSRSKQKVKNIKIKLSNIEDGASYFLKVLAEDEKGNILNDNDDFFDDEIQKEWEKKGFSEEAKKELPYKLKCDSIDFDFVVDEEVEEEEKGRKDKLNNVLQAFFKYNLSNLKELKEIESPTPAEFSNNWLNDKKKKQSSTFHINYSDKHNFQIILSTKLREIENVILDNASLLGYVNASISSNNTTLGLQSVEFVESELSEIVPSHLIKQREDLFEKIKNSNENGDGVLETTNLFELKNLIQGYVQSYMNWLKVLSSEISEEGEQEEIKLLFANIQFLDVVKLRTKLPKGNSVSALLLSPLHPLRLSWFLSLIQQFENWYEQTLKYDGHFEEWTYLEELFLGKNKLNPSNNPYALIEPNNFANYEYIGEVSYGWGIYLKSEDSDRKNSLVPLSHQLKYYFRHLLNIDSKNFVENDLSNNLIKKHIRNFLLQHPYTDTLILNLFNVGDAQAFADAFIGLSSISQYGATKFEVRIFIGEDSLIDHGKALKNLLNPESNTSEDAELFSQPSKNRLFPKLRFSINNIDDFIQDPANYNAHISFLVNPFLADIILHKPSTSYKADYVSGLILDSETDVDITHQVTWSNYIKIEENLEVHSNGLYNSFQTFTAGSLAAGNTDSVPARRLRLTDKDQVLLSHLHSFSDWVITFDRDLGPQIFDQPSGQNEIPYLLDYIPGEELSGISSYLTTKPSTEIFGLLGPHFEAFDINVTTEEGRDTIKTILEDIRSVSASLVMQLNSSENRAFEAIGMAFSKRVLEKKGLLQNAFLVPIDLHQNLFNESNNKQRADSLFISINPEKRVVNISVLEVKCRTQLSSFEREELKVKMKEQVENTIATIKHHFDPNNFSTEDRLDREIKNKEFKTLLAFYIKRAHRYEYLSEKAYVSYLESLQTLNEGFEIKFNQLGFIFDFSFAEKHRKETFDNSMTIFTFGERLISEILDSESDLNTRRLEDAELDEELANSLAINSKLKPFISKYKSKLKPLSKKGDDKVTLDEENKEIDLGESDEKRNTENQNTSVVASTDINDSADTDIISVNTNSSENTREEKEYQEPDYDVLIGKTGVSNQYGMLGTSIHNKKIAIDLSGTNTISLFGVQGGGKSYTIGTVSEMVLKQFSNINKLPAPLAGVIFHYNESMDYEPEFTSMIHSNDEESQISKLKELYGAEPDSIDDVLILTPEDKLEERQAEFPSIEVKPIAFNSKELDVESWLFLLGAKGNDSTYIRQLKYMMKKQRKNITIKGLIESVEDSPLLSASQKALARQKLDFASEYINDEYYLRDVLRPGRLVIVDLRDEFIVKDEALGIFVIMLNIFAGVKKYKDKHFNKFIVFDEAHKYMDNKELTASIVDSIRVMRHKGVSIMIASQDPPSLPIEIIELSSIVLLHKFNSPQWLKHVQKALIQIENLNPSDLSILKPGEAFLWTTKGTDANVTTRAIKITTRPRVTKHGGATIQATGI